MSVQTLKRKAPSPPLDSSEPAAAPISRPSLNAWISAVIAAGRVTEGGVQTEANGTFATPAPRKPASPTFKLSELASPQRSIPTPRAVPNGSPSAGTGSTASGGGGGVAGSPPCSQQRSMLGFEDRRKSEDSFPGAFSPWQQPRQVSEAARSRPSSQRPSVNSRAFAEQRSAPAPQDSGSMLDVLATVCAVKGSAPAPAASESADRRSALEAAARAMPMDQVLKSALQIVAAERSIKNAAASVAAQRQAASPDAAPPTAKRFAAAAVPVVGGDAAAPARPVAKAVSQGGLSPSASGVSAAMNNALFPTPSVSTLQPAPSAGSPSRGFGGGMETQRSTFSYGAASLTAAASDSTPAMTDAIADVTALEGAISKTVAASGSSLSDARTASRLDRMLATLTGARRAMQRAHERAATDAAALAECRLQLQQSGKALAAANHYIVTNLSKPNSPPRRLTPEPVASPFAAMAAAAAVLPPWTPDRSPPVESDSDDRTARRQQHAGPADVNDALVQQLMGLTRPPQ